ncbi:MAG: hypothetical protein V3W19_15260 [Desulfatiglandales bacterium]
MPDKEKKERPTTGLSTGEEVEVEVLPESGPQPIAERTWERDGELTVEQNLDLTPADDLNSIGATKIVLFQMMFDLAKAEQTKFMKLTQYEGGKPSKQVIKKFNLSDNTTRFLATKELIEFHAPKSKINLTINLHKHMETSDARRDESKERIRSKLQIKS